MFTGDDSLAPLAAVGARTRSGCALCGNAPCRDGFRDSALDGPWDSPGTAGRRGNRRRGAGFRRLQRHRGQPRGRGRWGGTRTAPARDPAPASGSAGSGAGSATGDAGSSTGAPAAIPPGPGPEARPSGPGTGGSVQRAAPFTPFSCDEDAKPPVSALRRLTMANTRTRSRPRHLGASATPAPGQPLVTALRALEPLPEDRARRCPQDLHGSYRRLDQSLQQIHVDETYGVATALGAALTCRRASAASSAPARPTPHHERRQPASTPSSRGSARARCAGRSTRTR